MERPPAPPSTAAASRRPPPPPRAAARRHPPPRVQLLLEGAAMAAPAEGIAMTSARPAALARAPLTPRSAALVLGLQAGGGAGPQRVGRLHVRPPPHASHRALPHAHAAAAARCAARCWMTPSSRTTRRSQRAWAARARRARTAGHAHRDSRPAPPQLDGNFVPESGVARSVGPRGARAFGYPADSQEKTVNKGTAARRSA